MEPRQLVDQSQVGAPFMAQIPDRDPGAIVHQYDTDSGLSAGHVISDDSAGNDSSESLAGRRVEGGSG